MPVVAIIETSDQWNAFWAGLADSWQEISIAPALEQAAQALEDVHLGYFVNEESPTGDKWTPLAASTIARKGHDQILIDTEALAQSLIAGGIGAIRGMTNDRGSGEVWHGTAIPHSIYHTAEIDGREHVGINEQHLHGFALNVLEVALDSWREVA